MSITKEYINNLLLAINKNYDTKLNNLQKEYNERISNLEKEILLLKNSKSNENVIDEFKDNIKDNIDKKLIRTHLEINSVTSDFNLFKIIFLKNKKKSDYPLIYKKRSFKYWLNNEWNVDKNCEYIMKTIIDILKRLYFSVNKYEDYNGNLERFINNQTHINKLTEKKYTSTFIDKLKKIL